MNDRWEPNVQYRLAERTKKRLPGKSPDNLSISMYNKNIYSKALPLWLTAAVVRPVHHTGASYVFLYATFWKFASLFVNSLDG